MVAGLRCRLPMRAEAGQLPQRLSNIPHLALLHPSFRAYADYMEGGDFEPALDLVLSESTLRAVAVLCAETLWWRCHRRLIADAAALLRGADVLHLGHTGKQEPHRLTEGVRALAGHLLYDGRAD